MASLMTLGARLLDRLEDRTGLVSKTKKIMEHPARDHVCSLDRPCV
jgi:hypothetical protein